MELSSIEELSDGSYVSVVVSSADGTFAGPKERFQNYLREQVNEWVTELANEILKARAGASSQSQ